MLGEVADSKSGINNGGGIVRRRAWTCRCAVISSIRSIVDRVGPVDDVDVLAVSDEERINVTGRYIV